MFVKTKAEEIKKEIYQGLAEQIDEETYDTLISTINFEKISQNIWLNVIGPIKEEHEREIEEKEREMKILQDELEDEDEGGEE